MTTGRRADGCQREARKEKKKKKMMRREPTLATRAENFRAGNMPPVLRLAEAPTRDGSIQVGSKHAPSASLPRSAQNWDTSFE